MEVVKHYGMSYVTLVKLQGLLTDNKPALDLLAQLCTELIEEVSYTAYEEGKQEARTFYNK